MSKSRSPNIHREAGKGDTPRPVDREKYEDNYDKIFRKKEPCQNYGRCNCLSPTCDNIDEDQR